MIFSALINNITLIISLSILYRFIVRRWKHGSRTGQAISGFLFGAVAVVGMMNPLIISPGLIFDGRSIIISIAGFVGGWVTALIAALMGIIYRTWLGGPGAIMGVSVIASSAAIGIAYHYIRRRRPHMVTPLHLIGFGIIVHICMLALTMTLPSSMKYEVLSNIAIPVILMYPLGTLLVCVVLLDLESRLHAEDALLESEVRYRELVENANEAIFVAQDGKLVFHNPRTAKVIGYSSDELISRPFVEFIHPDDRNMVLDRHFRRMKGEELPHIYSFRIIRGDSKVIWVELNTVVVNWKGKPATLNFLGEITERKRAEEELQHTLDRLRKAFGATVQVMVSAVETRDPYTTGHQIRSADLARTIASEMGLSEERIEGIRIAGTIHDIGKLSIPAEILSKPTKLSDIEFSLIKEHANRGYEILKDVESPWPLAEIVYQHHERMDGSGYPRKLKGEEILIEARILTVADVVEAMASHRPYRPGLGIDAALDEIEKNSGIFYDKAVSDACLRLFREKSFTLEGAL
jgi:PAS domain S-box-containing protein